MTATVQTIKKFCEETGLGRSKVYELISEGVIPVLPAEYSNAPTIINKAEFDRRVMANQIVLPTPPRVLKRNKEKEQEND